MDKFITKECYKHGETVFVLEGRGQYRCKKCRTGHAVERRRMLKRKSVEYLGGKCRKCGYNRCLNALEFHHRNRSEKEFHFGYTNRSWEKLKVELDKCDLLCANCHREEHDGEHIGALPDRKLREHKS
jgi:hypothetical protein